MLQITWLLIDIRNSSICVDWFAVFWCVRFAKCKHDITRLCFQAVVKYVAQLLMCYSPFFVRLFVSPNATRSPAGNVRLSSALCRGPAYWQGRRRVSLASLCGWLTRACCGRRARRCPKSSRKVDLTGFLRLGSAHEVADYRVFLATRTIPPKKI